MNWIKLTGMNDESVFINLSFVDTMTRRHVGSVYSEEITKLTLTNIEGDFIVLETPEQILKASVDPSLVNSSKGYQEAS